MKKLTFLSLAGASVREAQLSDHEPMINHNMLSWNIMMPGNYRRGEFNNGYELIEDQNQYHQRLVRISSVIAEICDQNRQIAVICLQEAPVRKEDIRVFIDACLQYPSLQIFKKSFEDTEVFTSWGLTTFIDSDRHDYEVISVPQAKDGLKDRIQSLRLKDQTKRVITNLHLPYGSKKNPKEMAQFVVHMMLKHLSAFTLAGDFNISFIEKEIVAILARLGQVFAPINNSTEYQVENGGSNTLESVDAIIFSDYKKNTPICNLSKTSLLRFTGSHHKLRFNNEKAERTVKLMKITPN
jgi:hypothetical protein